MATELGNTETVHLLLERQDIDVNIKTIYNCFVLNTVSKFNTFYIV